jgi:hypothetical protein
MTRRAFSLFVLILSATIGSAQMDGLVNTTVTLSIDVPTPSRLGQPVTLTATVNGPMVAGTVTFYDGTAILGTMPVSSHGGGQVSLATRFLPFGSHSLTALYADAVRATPSVSPALFHTVTAAPQDSFQPAVAYATRNFPGAVVTGDFNGDGLPDLAVANVRDWTTPVMGHVGIYVGTGDGQFLGGVFFEVPGGAAGLAVGDFGGDGRSDLAITNGATGTVTLLHGTPDNSFRKGVVWPVGRRPEAIAVGDFNADGRADLVVAIDPLDDDDGNVMVLLGQGDGSFQWPVPEPIAVGRYARRVVVADFNVDGRADLAVTNSSDPTVSVLLGGGDGTFGAPVPHLLCPAQFCYTGDLIATDVNHDGHADLVVTEPALGQVSVFRGTGEGGFAPIVSSPTGQQPQALVAGDFNGDGRTDLATTNRSATVSVLTGSGDGQFTAVAHYPVHDDPVALAAGDFNGDGGTDLAVTLEVDAETRSRGLDILLGRVIVPVTVNTSPAGLAFTVDGTTYTSPQTFHWRAGTDHVVETAAIQTGTPGTRFIFDGWSDGGATTSHVVVGPSLPTTLTARFRTQHRLTATASPATAGTVIVAPASRDGYYDHGTTVQLTATPNRGYTFANWTGSVTGTTNPRVVTMTGPMPITANFSMPFALR